MKVYIAGMSSTMGEDWAQLKSLPQYRKATKNMLMAAQVVKGLIGTEPLGPKGSLVLGSSYGELETTKDFLVALDGGVARPFLFQSSLHNATSGFLTMTFGIQGPSATISQRHFTAEKALEMAALFVSSGQSDFSLCVTVDSLVTGLEKAVEKLYPPNIKLGEGATVFILASEEGLKIINKRPLAILGAIETFEGEENSDFDFSKTYYDSNALKILQSDIQSSNPAFKVRIEKPTGGYSTIEWNLL